jgi:hypothetical protein
MEKFRVFLDNLGIRAKMWNVLFKKWRRGEENFNHKKKLAPPPKKNVPPPLRSMPYTVRTIFHWSRVTTV